MWKVLRTLLRFLALVLFVHHFNTYVCVLTVVS
jgi:hypothetical protein